MLLDNVFDSDARVEKEIHSLIRNGYDVTVVCLKSPSHAEDEQRDGYRILRWIEEGYNAPLRKSYTTFLKNCCKRILGLEFDVLHCHDFYMLSIGAAMKERRPGLFLIYDAHEYLAGWPFYRSSSGINKWKGFLVWKKLVQKERREIRKVDLVVTITDGIATRLQSNSGLKQKPLVVGNYPDKFTVTPDASFFRKAYEIPDTTRILVHSGSIYQDDLWLQKCFDLLARRSDVALVFVGNRPRFFEIEAKVSQHPEWRKSVFFHPYPKDQQDTIQLLSGADIGLLYVNDAWEAHRIGFSNRFVEYIMAGLPVIATPQEFTREKSNEHPCCEFYTATDFGTFETALDSALHRIEALRRGARLAAADMDWNTEIRKLLSHYPR